MTSEQQYDVVIIGGGAAGLSGAVALARSRRTVVVVDARHPRNAPAAAMHNYLGREGVRPADLLADGKLLCPFHHHRAHDPGWDTYHHPNGSTTFHRRT